MSEKAQYGTIDELVRRAQGGDDGAFDALVRRVYARMQRWALARTGDPDDADEVVQTALLRMHRSLGTYDGRSKFTTWLYRVVGSAAGDVHRQRRRHRRLADRVVRLARPRDRADPRAQERVERGETVAVVRTFFEELPDRQREVFDLCDLQGYAPAEVAEMLGLEPVTARTHLHRARRTIRERIMESHPELREGYRS